MDGCHFLFWIEVSLNCCCGEVVQLQLSQWSVQVLCSWHCSHACLLTNATWSHGVEGYRFWVSLCHLTALTKLWTQFDVRGAQVNNTARWFSMCILNALNMHSILYHSRTKIYEVPHLSFVLEFIGLFTGLYSVNTIVHSEYGVHSEISTNRLCMLCVIISQDWVFFGLGCCMS